METTGSKTLTGIFLETSERFSHRPAIRFRKDGRWTEETFNELRQKVLACACGLRALGCEKGNHIALLSENRPEWFYSDLGILCLGAVNVPLYATLKQEQVCYIIKQSESRFVFVENKEQLGKLRHVIDTLPQVEKLIVFDPVGVDLAENVISFKELLSIGEKQMQKNLDDCLAVAARVVPEDLASLVYTSGTTGQPKGVMLTHGNFVSNIRDLKTKFHIDENDVVQGILPLSHVLERCASYYTIFLASGSLYIFTESMETVARDIAEMHPTLIVAVPRLFEKIYLRIMDMIKSGSNFKKGLFNWAMQVGRTYNIEKRRGEPGILLKQQYRIASNLVFRKIHQRFGGRIRYFISGGASLEPRIAHFFASVGVKIMEGYGLTETAPVNSVNYDDNVRLGSVGKALESVNIKLAEDDEILIKGPNVTMGYYKKPTETQELFNDEGWLKTGDIGRIDNDGFLWIIDRKKEIIVTSGGKNIAPQPIESMLTTSRYIANVMLVGDRRNFISALVVPDFEPLKEWCTKKGLGDLAPDAMIKEEEVYNKIKSEIMECIAGLPRYEQVKQIVLLARPWTIEGGELTPTMKLKRRVILKKYGSHIEALYRNSVRRQ